MPNQPTLLAQDVGWAVPTNRKQLWWAQPTLRFLHSPSSGRARRTRSSRSVPPRMPAVLACSTSSSNLVCRGAAVAHASDLSAVGTLAARLR